MRASIFLAIFSSALLVAAAPTQADLTRAQAILDKCNTDLDAVKTRLLESYNKTRESRGMPAQTLEDAEFVTYADANPTAQGIKTRCTQNEEQVKAIQGQLDGSAGGEETPADPNAPPSETGSDGPSSETPPAGGVSDSASQSGTGSATIPVVTITSTTTNPVSSPTQSGPGDFAFRTGPAGWAVGALATVVFFVS